MVALLIQIFGAAAEILQPSTPAPCPARLNVTLHVKVPCAKTEHADRPRERHVALLVGDPVVSWMTDEHHDPIDVRWAPHAAEYAA